MADSGDLETGLTDLLITVGEAAGEDETAVVTFIDELQYIPEEQLAALISALHRERLKALERENRESKRANEIFRQASAFFAQSDLDRRRLAGYVLGGRHALQ